MAQRRSFRRGPQPPRALRQPWCNRSVFLSQCLEIHGVPIYIRVRRFQAFISLQHLSCLADDHELPNYTILDELTSLKCLLIDALQIRFDALDGVTNVLEICVVTQLVHTQHGFRGECGA